MCMDCINDSVPVKQTHVELSDVKVVKKVDNVQGLDLSFVIVAKHASHKEDYYTMIHADNS